jgi:hypothetical protein
MVKINEMRHETSSCCTESGADTFKPEISLDENRIVHSLVQRCVEEKSAECRQHSCI